MSTVGPIRASITGTIRRLISQLRHSRATTARIAAQWCASRLAPSSAYRETLICTRQNAVQQNKRALNTNAKDAKRMSLVLWQYYRECLFIMCEIITMQICSYVFNFLKLIIVIRCVILFSARIRSKRWKRLENTKQENNKDKNNQEKSDGNNGVLGKTFIIVWYFHSAVICFNNDTRRDARI